MQCNELKAIRQSFRMSVTEMGRALGLRGESHQVSRRYREWETGTVPIPRWAAMLARIYVAQTYVDEWTTGPDGEDDIIVDDDIELVPPAAAHDGRLTTR